VLVLLAGSDDVAPHHRCKPVLEISSGEGDVKIIEYAGARHTFDSSELPPKMEYAFGTLGYHPQAAAAAWAEVIRFLQPTR
jgi:dienelactone hydrolase